MNKNLLQNLLSQDGFFMMNKILIKEIGLIETAVLTMLIDQNKQFGDDFFSTTETAKEKLNIGRKTYDSALTALRDIGFVNTTRKGLPAKTYFVINYDLVASYLKDQSVQSSLSKTDNQVCPKSTTNNNIDNNIPLNNNPTLFDNKDSLIISPNRGRRSFVKPTIEEIRSFIEANNLTVDPEEFFYSNEAKGWVVGKNKTPMKNWKATIHTWEASRKRRILDITKGKTLEERRNEFKASLNALLRDTEFINDAPILSEFYQKWTQEKDGFMLFEIERDKRAFELKRQVRLFKSKYKH